MAIASAIRRASLAASSGLRLATSAAALSRQPVEQVVGLDAEALASRDLDERPVRVLARVVAELARGGVRQRHHLVRVVDRVRRLLVDSPSAASACLSSFCRYDCRVSMTLQTHDARPKNGGCRPTPPPAPTSSTTAACRPVARRRGSGSPCRAGRTSRAGRPCPCRRRSRCRRTGR